MANFLEYLNWRGDLSFERDPFNEVDNLILSTLSYINFAPEAEGKTLREISDQYLISPHDPDDKSVGGTTERNFDKFASTVRFGSLLLTRHSNETDPNKTLQFSATTFVIAPELRFVAFRGTDTSVVGWEEDFHLTFRESVSAQRHAARYLDEVLSQEPGMILVGGHSKGGNLALFAAASLDPKYLSRLLRIFNNDGPGFLPDFINTPGYLAILPLTISYIPEDSRFGLLLEHREDTIIIKSSSFSFYQHDPFNWQILGTCFERGVGLSRGSLKFKATSEAMIANTQPEEREEIINLAFRWLSSNITSFHTVNLSNITSLVSSFKNLSPEERDKLLGVSRSILAEWLPFTRTESDEYLESYMAGTAEILQLPAVGVDDVTGVENPFTAEISVQAVAANPPAPDEDEEEWCEGDLI